ncbi:MAG: hypothetical protein ACRDPL_19870, partial [Propionibacteriaceae bacterium]
MPVATIPAWAIVGIQTRMPVVIVVTAASSHLRIRRVMIFTSSTVVVIGSARIAGQMGQHVSGHERAPQSQ